MSPMLAHEIGAEIPTQAYLSRRQSSFCLSSGTPVTARALVQRILGSGFGTIQSLESNPAKHNLFPQTPAVQ